MASAFDTDDLINIVCETMVGYPPYDRMSMDMRGISVVEACMTTPEEKLRVMGPEAIRELVMAHAG